MEDMEKTLEEILETGYDYEIETVEDRFLTFITAL